MRRSSFVEYLIQNVCETQFPGDVQANVLLIGDGLLYCCVVYIITDNGDL